MQPWILSNILRSTHPLTDLFLFFGRCLLCDKYLFLTSCKAEQHAKPVPEESERLASTVQLTFGQDEVCDSGHGCYRQPSTTTSKVRHHHLTWSVKHKRTSSGDILITASPLENAVAESESAPDLCFHICDTVPRGPSKRLWRVAVMLVSLVIPVIANDTFPPFPLVWRVVPNKNATDGTTL